MIFRLVNYVFGKLKDIANKLKVFFFDNLFQNKVVKYWPDEHTENKEREWQAHNATYKVKFLKETVEIDYILRELLLIREPNDGKVITLCVCVCVRLHVSMFVEVHDEDEEKKCV